MGKNQTHKSMQVRILARFACTAQPCAGTVRPFRAAQLARRPACIPVAFSRKHAQAQVALMTCRWPSMRRGAAPAGQARSRTRGMPAWMPRSTLLSGTRRGLRHCRWSVPGGTRGRQGTLLT